VAQAAQPGKWGLARKQGYDNMTNEETTQVNTYIAQLNSAHHTEMSELRRQLMSEQHSRRLAQEQLSKRDEAMRELVKLNPPEAFKIQLHQILNHYCPDYFVPF
jgi:hypothetical protein